MKQFYNIGVWYISKPSLNYQLPQSCLNSIQYTLHHRKEISASNEDYNEMMQRYAVSYLGPHCLFKGGRNRD